MDQIEDGLLPLIEKTAAGDREAFCALYQRSSAKLFGVILRILKQEDLAEDVLKEVYVTIWEKAALYRSEQGRVMSWMIAIARNKAIDVRRRTDEKMFATKGDDRQMQAALDLTVQNLQAGQLEQRLTLEHCLNEIEKKSRDCVVLAYHYGCSRDELAQRYDVPQNTIKTWLRRALMRLKECLER